MLHFVLYLFKFVYVFFTKVYGWSPYYHPYGHVPTLAGSPAAVPVGSTAPAPTGIYPPMMFLPYPTPYYPMPIPSATPTPPQGDLPFFCLAFSTPNTLLQM